MTYNNFIKNNFDFSNKKKPIYFSTIWLSCIFVLVFSQIYFLKLGPPADAVKDFKNLKINLNKIKNKKNIKIYFVSQGTFGHEASAFFYILSPFTKSHWCWSFTNNNIYGKLMHWDCKGSIVSRLQGYTHVYVYKTDNIFSSEQQSYFKEGLVEEKKLYTIKVKTNSAELYLNPIN